MNSSNPKELEAGWTSVEIRKSKIEYIQYISQIGRSAKLRQRVIATAAVYFRRFYLLQSYVDFDPRLVAPTCLYLASKAEESTLQARHVVQAIKKVRKEAAFHFEVKGILEMEMLLVEELASCMAVFHPYRPLQMMLTDCGLQDKLKDAWALVNDAYLTELILVHAPHMIAAAVVYIMGISQVRTSAAPMLNNLAANVCNAFLW